ncbi:non-ribosomal peptide synthetase [Clostridium felsineum]|uniref:non-ribosomal peptide synthetase n=1 Tax=Clostridium felsineum TaxID=36839 RepID=UPI00098CBB83|nr:non-ribosomal peptide synthetase [Clostridium felsineum]URZ00311.1 D-alanine--D-alanyl carrier protein ligase [Clostridium felsineum]
MEDFQKLNKDNVEDMIPLTSMQEEMLFTYLKDENSEQYFEQLSLNLKGNINIEMFKKSWQNVINSNEMLRTIYRWKNISHPIQIILKNHTIPIFEIDLSNLEYNLKKVNLDKIKKKDKKRGIDITREPMRITLCKITEDEYEMIISNHHIIYDGWSNSIILKEFFGFYNGFSDGKDISRIRKNRYREFIKFNEGVDKISQKEYWKEYLDKIDTVTTVPFKVSSQYKKNKMKDYSIKLSGEIKEKLEVYCKDNGFSKASFFYGLWAVLLQKYNNSKDALIGITTSNRKSTIKGITEMVGLFINTMPLRVKSFSSSMIVDILRNVQSDLTKINENSDLSINEIKESINFDSRSGLFDSIVVVENYPLDMNDLNKGKHLKVNSYSMYENTNFDLTFEISLFDEIVFKYSFNEVNFEKGFIENVNDTYIRFIKTVVEDNKLRLYDLQLVSKIEKEKILNDFKGKEIKYPKHQSIYELFKEKVLEYPNNISLVFKNEKITYKQLDSRVSELAKIIINFKIGKGNIVGIIVDRSLEMVVSMLAVLKSGAAYLPIDPEYPLDRINYIIEDSKVSLILTKKKLDLNFNFIGDIIYLDDKKIYKLKKASSILERIPKDTAYIIYTSGSTGKPKGVVIRHKSIVNTLHWRKNYYKFNSSDVILQLPSFSFDSSVEDIFTPLISGASVVILTKDQRYNFSDIEKIIKDEKITHFLSVPSFYKTMLQEISDCLVNMRTITIAGENFKENLVREHFEKLSNVELFNEYGPTENSVCSTVYKFDKENIQLLIGNCIDNTKCYILDEDNNVMPIGVPGELCVSGPGLAYGYLGKENLTKEKFISNPINTEERMYKTGDLAKWESDGNIKFLGRIDHQIKIRGFRIELEEIENVILKSEDIDNVVVIQNDKSINKDTLCAFLVASNEISIDKIKENIANSLPNYMIPNYFIKLEQMPLTPNAKVDRSALLQILKDNINEQKLIEKPSNDVETNILNIWREVLQINDIDVNSNLFDVGGDSLKLMRIHFKIDKLYKEKISIAQMFSVPTIRAISNKILGIEESREKEESDIKEELISTENDIAIIGVSCEISKAKSAEEFWDLIANKTDCIKELSKLRKKDCKNYLRAISKFKQYEKIKFPKAAFLDEIDKFDYEFFGLSPKEASLMDPYQRIFLESVYKAFEDAGYTNDELKGSRTGIYVGYSNSGGNVYQDMISNICPEDIDLSVVGNIPMVIASRISYLLDLKGPALLIDTACSSSLVAVNYACQDIKNKKCNLAVVGGVRVSLNPYIKKENIGIASTDGKTRAFDDSSDGTGGGEGVISIVLKPLSNAEKDNDNIYAVIKGTSVNQDGSSIGLTAPNPEAQAQVIIKAWQDAGVKPEEISYLEAHGTGTKLGDPIEIEGLTRAFSKYTDKRQFCAIGSVKSNIGHLDNLSGLAGLLKCIMALKNKKLPPTIHFNKPNRKINFISAPVYINDKLTTWQGSGRLRKAGISSFGLGGTNCHVLLGEAPIRNFKEELKDRYRFLVISAKNYNTLNTLIDSYVKFLYHNVEVNLDNMCYTAAIGRNHYEFRVAVYFKNREELLEKLNNIKCEDLREINSEGIYYSTISSKNSNEKNILSKINEITTNKDIGLSEIKKLCELYIRHNKIPWKEIYKNKKRFKISIPVYPFERRRCWLNIDSSDVNKSNYHRVVWEKSDEVQLQNYVEDNNFIVFKDSEGISDRLISYLESKNKYVIEVSIGNEFTKINDKKYIITSSYEDNYKLMNEVKHKNIEHILYFSHINEKCSFKDNELSFKDNITIVSVFNLIQSTVRNFKTGIKITFISQYVNKVLYDQNIVNPLNSQVFGLCKVADQEYSNVKFKCIDIDECINVANILKEAMSITNTVIVAYRNSKRYVECLEEFKVENEEKSGLKIASKGVYVITGGTGGIGLEIAKYLSKKGNINIVLIGRKEFPPVSEWDKCEEDKNLYRVINKVRQIENNGSKVFIYSADISDYEKTKEVFEDIKKNIGEVKGLFHAAGVGGNGFLTKMKDREFLKVLSPKVKGTLVLSKIIEGMKLDFMTLFSSATAITGAKGQGDYTAANTFLDSFASFMNLKGTKTISINWSQWKETGMAFEYGSTDNSEIFTSLETKEAIFLFDNIINLNIERIMIGNLKINHKKILINDELIKIINDDLFNRENELNKEKNLIKKNTEIKVQLEGRIKNSYSEIENEIASIWYEVLGFDKFNVFDNFFEIGGDSISINRVFSEIEKLYPNRITLVDLFTYTTIESIAGLIAYDDSKELALARGSLELDSQIKIIIDKLKSGKFEVRNAIDEFKALEVKNG